MSVTMFVDNCRKHTMVGVEQVGMSQEVGPEITRSTDQELPDHEMDGDRTNDLRDILVPAKARLLQQILASTTGALSAVELAARNEITESTIRDHLRDLRNRDRPIVMSFEATESLVPNGIPCRYYAVTDYGIKLLK